MPTITTTPALVAPNREAHITIALAQSGANFVRVWCTIAPPGSELAGKLESSTDPRNRVLVYQGNGGVAHPWRQTFDRGGKYTFVAQEYVRGGSGGPAYQGDPNAADKETKLGAEATLELYVGQRVTQPIGPASDRATVVLWVWNETIQETSVTYHGEASPTIVTTATPTPRVATAINSASVRTALTNLIGVTVTTALGDIPALVSNYVTTWNNHLDEGGIHANNDNDNEIPSGFATASTPKNFQRFTSEALKYMRRHFTNDSGEGVSSANYHGAGADWADMPLYESAGSLAEAVGAFADLHRCYELHRLTNVHETGDSNNRLTALPKLFEVHRQFLAVLAASEPTVPPAQSSGVQKLVSAAGFSEG